MLPLGKSALLDEKAASEIFHMVNVRLCSISKGFTSLVRGECEHRVWCRLAVCVNVCVSWSGGLGGGGVLGQ